MNRVEACNYLRSSGFSDEQIRTIEGAFTCEDCVSKQAVAEVLFKYVHDDDSVGNTFVEFLVSQINALPSVTPQEPYEEAIQKIKDVPPVNPQEPKTGRCKDCKHFEYNSVAKWDGIPIIVAHEICSRWGDGCKTSEDGYCFLFEPKEGGEAE